MVEMCLAVSQEPCAWTNDSLGGKAGLSRALTGAEIAAMDVLLSKTSHKAPQEVTVKDFDHPDLRPLIAEVFELLVNGRGAIILTGISPERYSYEQMERLYWGLGTHWGHAVVQSSQGDRLGRVANDPNNPNNRGYRTTEELFVHTDSNEIVGLMCLQNAASGGYSRLVSAISVYNELLTRRPDLLPSLYEGFYYATRESANTAQPVTDYKVPIYCYVDGKLSCRYNGDHIERAAAMKGGLPEKLAAAIKEFHAITEELQVVFMLEPGEIMLLNNFTVLHARTNFEDSKDKKRNLLRLWLDLPNGRPVVPEIKKLSKTYGTKTPQQMAAASN